MLGFFGAFALLVAVLMLFPPTHLERKAVVVMSIFGGLLGGGVGLVAWALGPSLGGVILTLFRWKHANTPIQNARFAAVYAVWQPVMAVVVGALTQHDEGPG